MDINMFFDYPQCTKCKCLDDLEKENRCKFDSLINELSNNLFECELPKDPLNIIINDSYKKDRIYGIRNIIELTDRAINTVCSHTELRVLLMRLRTIIDRAIHGYPSRKDDFEELSSIREEIIRLINELDCNSCNVKQCYQLIKRISAGIPYLVNTLGEFSVRNYSSRAPEIELFIKSIADTSGSKTEFDEEYWNTLNHETFHAYHYLFFLKNAKTGHWDENCRENRWEKEKKEERDSDDIFVDLRNQDNILEGYQSDESIVKESLASYCEYCLLSKEEITNPIRKKMLREKMAQSLKDSWFRNSPAIWPYAGAKAFYQWGIRNKQDNYFNNDLFRKVLITSLDDWGKACDLILENI